MHFKRGLIPRIFRELLSRPVNIGAKSGTPTCFAKISPGTDRKSAAKARSTKVPHNSAVPFFCSGSSKDLSCRAYFGARISVAGHQKRGSYENNPGSSASVAHGLAGPKPFQRHLDYRHKHKPASSETDTVFACQRPISRP